MSTMGSVAEKTENHKRKPKKSEGDVNGMKSGESWRNPVMAFMQMPEEGPEHTQNPNQRGLGYHPFLGITEFVCELR